ncbi:MAG TPA: hypothetical protein VFI46_17460, partial [Jiangellaceae bacterium]|nr:hypothetical protein [Jiangellaceae bacterium]
AGGVAWDRRGGGPVDVSPGVAAELALWGLLTVPPPPRPMVPVARRPSGEATATVAERPAGTGEFHQQAPTKAS